jgi:hypothetical protein
MISEILWLTMWLDITLKCSIDFLSRFILQRQQCSDISIKFGEAFVEAFRFLGCCNGLILKGITFDAVIDWIYLPYLAVSKIHRILRTKAQLSNFFLFLIEVVPTWSIHITFRSSIVAATYQYGWSPQLLLVAVLYLSHHNTTMVEQWKARCDIAQYPTSRLME